MEEAKKTQIVAEKPKEGDPWDVIIVGSGPAGLTAAIYTTRGAASTLIIGGEKWGGQLMLTTTVDNWPATPGIQGPELMQKMKDHALLFGGEFLAENVKSINVDKKPFEVETSSGKKFFAKSVILATGAETKWLGIPGEDKLRGRGVSSCAPCDAPFFKDKEVVVIGGGDAAMEEALVLTKYSSLVTIIHRKDEFRASKAMQDKVFKEEKKGKIKIMWNSEVKEFVGENSLEKLIILNNKTNKESEFETHGAFVAIGHRPSSEIMEGKIDLDEKGHIKRLENSSTSVGGIFVAGDVHDFSYMQAITASAFGCMSAMDALRYLDSI